MVWLCDDRRKLLEPDNPDISVRNQCLLLDINRAGYYYEPKPIDEETLVLMKLVDKTYTKYPYFGSRQMSNYLRLNGYDIGRSKIRSIYEQLGLTAACPGPHTSKPHPEHKVYPYLLRDVKITKCDQVWSTDITFLPTKKGFVYLMAIIDWFSRYVLDWELGITLEADFCIEALYRVLRNGRCDIFNTDQGSQFTSDGFIKPLLDHAIKISMDGKGRALDNIFVERLWRTLKYECIYLHEWETVREVRQGVGGYFNFYNNERPHQSLGGQTPASIYLN